MKINLLPKKRKVWQVTYKTLHIVASLALIFNMSMIGVFLNPNEAKACHIDVVKGVDVNTVQKGEQITYDLTYSNNYHTPFYDAQLIDLLPANTIFENATDGGYFDNSIGSNGAVVWDLGDVPAYHTPGTTVYFTVTVLESAECEAVIENQATIYYYASSPTCEARTIGYWKNHTSVLENNLPQTFGLENITILQEALDILQNPGGLINNFKAQLLATKFNVSEFGIGSATVNGTGGKTVAEIVGEAESLLILLQDSDPPNDPTNSAIENYKDLLDGINNMENINCGTYTSSNSRWVYTTVICPVGTITVVKNVIPDDNSLWDFELTGPTDGSVNDLGDGDSHQFIDRTQGTYNLTEVTDSNYSMSVDCGGKQVTSITDGVSFDLSEDEDVTCTFTNTGNTGYIQGKKFNDKNDNGIRNTGDNFMDDWNIRLYDSSGTVLLQNMNTGDDTIPAENVTEGQYRFEGLGLGTYYVCEEQKDGWTQTRPSSVNNPSGAIDEAPYCFEVIIDTPGQEVKGKQFGNHRDTGEVTFEKIVTSGTNDSSEWTFEVDGTFYNHGQTAIFPTDNYTVTEHGPNGYINTNISGICSTTQTTEVGSMTVTENGGTCTFTNAEDTGSLKVIKEVIGGTALPENFGFRLVGSTGPYTYPATNTDYVMFNNLLPDTYSAEEYTDEPGYTLTNSTCDDVVVTAGNTAECTMTNTRDTGDLLVNKEVDLNGDGVFTIGNVGANRLGFKWGLDTERPRRDMGSDVTVVTGSYSVTENDVDGYHFVGWYKNGTRKSCEDPQGTEFPSNFRVTTDNIEITLCNARDTGDLTIIKAVDSDGDDEIDYHNTGWTYDIAPGDQNYDMGSTQTLVTGNYTVNEDQHTNYHSIGWRCTDGTNGQGETLDVEVTTQGVTCIFANERDTGDIRIKKYNDLNGDGEMNGNDYYLTGWEFEVTEHGNTTVVGSGKTGDDGDYLIIEGLPTGQYDVTELLEDGWINTDPGTVPAVKTITVNYNETTTVKFGNFKLIDVEICKYIDVNGDGDTIGDPLYTEEGGWLVFLDYDTPDEQSAHTGKNGCYTFTNVGPGTHTIVEAILAGWTQSYPSPITYYEFEAVSGFDRTFIFKREWRLGW